MKTPVSLRLDEQLLQAAKSAAAKEHRSFANLVEVALAERIGYSLDRRLVVSAPEGAAGLRGAKVVPAVWETPEDVARAQASFDRLVDLVAEAEEQGGEENSSGGASSQSKL